MPRPRKSAARSASGDELDFESGDDAYAEPDDFLEGLRSAIARVRSTVGETFDLGAGRRYIDIDGLGAADYGD